MNGKMTAKKWEKTAADKKADASGARMAKGPKDLAADRKGIAAYNKRNGKK